MHAMDAHSDSMLGQLKFFMAFCKSSRKPQFYFLSSLVVIHHFPSIKAMSIAFFLVKADDSYLAAFILCHNV